MTYSLSYKDAGVDIANGEALVERIKPLAKSTMRQGVLDGIGGFGGLFEIAQKYKEPVLVSSTDGVGTKLKLACLLGKHDDIGQDLVAMSVNDILVQGAEPLFFLDYFACDKLDLEVATKVIAGIAKGCKLAKCALLGGETAEMPGMYSPNEYDLAGFAVGVVEKNNIIDGKNIAVGDAILGIASSGAHANGYSLIRKIITDCNLDLNKNLAQNFDGKSLAEILLTPTKIYVSLILGLLSLLPAGTIKAMAHITGGGLLQNLPRMLNHNYKENNDLGLIVEKKFWPMPPIFDLLQEHGNIADVEMHKVFNCGIGMALVVPLDYATQALDYIRTSGERAWQIGVINKRIDQETCVTII